MATAPYFKDVPEFPTKLGHPREPIISKNNATYLRGVSASARVGMRFGCRSDQGWSGWAMRGGL
jgi:hypothetical protein